MIRCILVLFALLVLTQSAWAQTCEADASRERFSQIDQYAASAPMDAEKDIESLVKYLIKPAKTDVEKLRALYAWVTHKVAYDTEEYFSGNYSNKDPEEAFKSRKSICGSFAALYKAMARLADVDVLKVDGDAKGFGYASGTPFSGPGNHSWNAVKIDGKWRLLDCAWGAGYVASDRKFVYKFSEFYFLATPQQFIYTHFPFDPKLQFLDKPMSKQDFINCPNLRPGFFEKKLDMLDEYHGKIKSDGMIELTLSSPEDVALQVRLRRGEEKIDDSYAFVQKEQDNWKVRATFPSDGTYTIKLFAKSKEAQGNYEWVADYLVDNVAKDGSPKELPKMLGAFYTRQACLHHPMSGRLKPNTVENFNISAPGAENVSVVVSGKWINLQKSGNDFAGDVEVDSGEILVVAKYPGSSSADVLLKYNASAGSTVAKSN